MNKTILLRFLIICITTLSMRAQSIGVDADALQIIRNDRVWEYVRAELPLLSSRYMVERIRVRFDGAKEIDGNIYHSLIFDSGEKYWFSFDEKHDTYNYKNTEIISESPAWLPCYMQEIDGILYRYNANSNSDETVYNFNLSDNNNFYTFGFTVNNEAPHIDGYLTLYLKETSTIEIEDKQCKCMSVVLRDELQYFNPSDYDNDLYLIEGIGLVDKRASTGTIAYPGITRYLTGATQPTNWYLNNVYNTDGDVIFTGVNWSPECGVHFDVTEDDLQLLCIDNTIQSTSKGHEMVVEVYRMTGESVRIVEGYSEIVCDLSTMSPGIYIARVHVSGLSKNKFAKIYLLP